MLRALPSGPERKALPAEAAIALWYRRAIPPPLSVQVESVAVELVTHTVRLGESLASIALRYGMRRDQLVQLNLLLTPQVFIGLQPRMIRAAASSCCRATVFRRSSLRHQVAPGQVLRVTPPNKREGADLATRLRNHLRAFQRCTGSDSIEAPHGQAVSSAVSRAWLLRLLTAWLAALGGSAHPRGLESGRAPGGPSHCLERSSDPLQSRRFHWSWHTRRRRASTLTPPRVTCRRLLRHTRRTGQPRRPRQERSLWTQRACRETRAVSLREQYARLWRPAHHLQLYTYIMSATGESSYLTHGHRQLSRVAVSSPARQPPTGGFHRTVP